MIKGVRVQATNTASIDHGTGATTLLTVPVGKTFVLTDLICVMTYTGVATFGSSAVLRLSDSNIAAAACTSTTGNGIKLIAGMPMIASTTTATFLPNGSLVMHFPENGPEFTTGCTPMMSDTHATPVSTGSLWISGMYI